MERLVIFCAAVILVACASCTHAAGTAFTYQGKLTDAAGLPLSGTFDLVFRLWPDSASASQIGSDLILDDFAVNQGFLTAPLDFGAQPFNEEALWLGIEIDGEELPRVEITSVPFALHAKGPWLTAGQSLWYDGSVGIGTDVPQARLDVRGSISLGEQGQYRVPAAKEELLILRGYIDSFGAKTRGSGFSSSRPAVGAYEITFDQPFAEPPSISVTPVGGTVVTFIDSVSSAGCDLRTCNLAGAFVNAGFSIVITGAR